MTSSGQSRLEIDCGRPARYPPLSEQPFSLSSLVLPASAHEVEEFMNAADEKRQLHKVMRARQRLNTSLRAQVSGRPPALRNGDSFFYKCRALSEWLARPSDSYLAAAQNGYRLYGRNCCSLSPDKG
jgi:hypothetical protein